MCGICMVFIRTHIDTAVIHSILVVNILLAGIAAIVVAGIFARRSRYNVIAIGSEILIAAYIIAAANIETATSEKQVLFIKHTHLSLRYPIYFWPSLQAQHLTLLIPA